MSTETGTVTLRVNRPVGFVSTPVDMYGSIKSMKTKEFIV